MSLCIKSLIHLTMGAMLTTSSALAQDDAPWAERTTALGKIAKQPEGVLNKKALDHLIEVGEELFTAKFMAADGAGRPGATQAIIPTKIRHRRTANFARISGPDAAACSSCHNEPLIGGAGDFVTNVFVSEGFTNADFDTSDPQFSNERGTNHLFGAGLVELLAREMSADLATIREKALLNAADGGEAVTLALTSKGVNFGKITAEPDGLVDLTKIDGVDTDLVVRPFSQKGVMTSLRQFTVNAMNHHHGMQPVERFGKRWTASADFDDDGKLDEMGAGDVAALVAWQATLHPPLAKEPENAVWQDAAAKGEQVFNDMGCAECHRPALPLTSLKFADPGPYDVSGTLNTRDVKVAATYDLALMEWAKTLPRNAKGHVMVPLFGDLKRHKMTDRSVNALGNELLSQRFVGRDIFMTAELWGLASTAPYGHRNDFGTLDEIIRAHGGASRKARDAYVKGKAEDRSHLIAYLKTLVLEE
ncbi:MAG: di-heme oxidoredictase family protein [Pseudomonadota bacterium]